MSHFCAAHAAVATPVDQRQQVSVFVAGVAEEGHLVALRQEPVDGGLADVALLAEKGRQFVGNQH